jgi:membrane-bound serine protease (ClpP class)
VKAIRHTVVTAFLIGSVFASLAPVAATSAAPTVLALSLEGVVDPFTASYVERGISEANSSNAEAVLLTIDTPGGLSSSMRDIVQSVLGSRVPVICLVGPPGARAASAGTFILLACHVAAMAPGTNVGAAHPVGISGAIESEKATNDAAAYIRSLAEQRGRNATWAERAVRDSVSVSAEQALRLGVIDLVEPDGSKLLGAVDGRTVTVAAEERVTLRTRGASVDTGTMGLGPRILHAVLTPDLAFLFFYLGIGLIIVELLHPGISIPGVLGILSLVAAFEAFGLLPVTLLGLALLFVSAIAFLVDLKVAHGAATAIGLIALILGGLFLFDPSVPNAQVSLPLIAAIGAVLALFFFFVVRAVLRARRRPVAAGMEAVIGETGVALTDLDPSGSVRARGETWSARSTGDRIMRGSQVRVTGMQGLRLEVGPLAKEAEAEAADVAEERSKG